MKNKHVDAIVVGAGAGGGIVAKELAVAGMKTILFERGDWPDYEEFPNDELINQRNQIIKPLHGPDRRKFPYVTQVGNKLVKSRIDKPMSYIAACVGSGTVTYGAMAWRFMPEDFKLKSLYGEYENCSLEDWPITYDELEPFYEKAEWEIGVSGSTEGNPFSPPRKKNFPMPPFEYNRESQFLFNACKNMGLHPFPIPMLRNSVPYNGRAACIRNRTCCGYVCPVDAKNGTQNTVIPVAMKTGNCEVRTNCVVAEIMMEGRKAVGIKYFDENKTLCTQTADIVVLAASAYESARLLLNTKTDIFPNGVGNNHDMVGRNLQSHPYSGAMGLVDFDLTEYKGPGATMAISDFNHNVKERIIGGVRCTEFYSLPNHFISHRPPNSPRWGAEHKKFQRENYRRILRMTGPIQEVPNMDSRVMVEDSVRDFWGIPVLKFSGARSDVDKKHSDWVSERVAEILVQAGAKKVWKTGGAGGRGGGQHQVGTCRMGLDPKISVTDKNCKVWETENIYVGDGSVLVTGGGFNPVLTIMALAYKTGDHIVKTYKKA